MFDKMKDTVNKAIIRQQCDAICAKAQMNEGGAIAAPQNKLFGSKAQNIVMGVLFASVLCVTAVFAEGAASDIANAIKDAAGGLFDAIKIVVAVIAAICVAVSAFSFFGGGERGMEQGKKKILYIGIGICVAFLAVPIVNFFIDLVSKNSTGLTGLHEIG